MNQPEILREGGGGKPKLPWGWSGHFLYRPGAGERKVFVATAKALGGASGRVGTDENTRDPMKFKNGDDSLNTIVSKLEASGKRVALPNKAMFMEAVSNANWN